jgi:hypothetical protein
MGMKRKVNMTPEEEFKNALKELKKISGATNVSVRDVIMWIALRRQEEWI